MRHGGAAGVRRASASFGVLASSVLVVEERRGWVEGVRTGKADGMEVVSVLGGDRKSVV